MKTFKTRSKNSYLWAMGVICIRKYYVFKGFRAKSKLLFNVFKVLPPESDRNLKNIK